MISAKEIDRQLKNIGVSFWFFGNAELRELRHILVEGEVIEHCLLGRYEGGYAVVCATTMRLLLIDKKPFYLTLEDIRYDMIVEVDFAHRLLDATVRVCTPGKTLQFTSFKKHELRLMTSYIQARVMAFRQQHVRAEQAQTTQTSWQPQIQLQPVQSTLTQPSYYSKPMRRMARAAIGGAMYGAEPAYTMPNDTYIANPYVQSPLIMRHKV